ncbi:hypothetical protein WG66_000098 [Moniliophthora roreri]|nr:hypothetical protein WG66_000098 [Moniliophthora roreri]
MQTSTLFFFVAMSISMLGSASPLAARDPQTCHPNFEGAGIAIIGANGPVTGNGVVGSYKPDWHIQQNGQPHPSYIFKDINNNNIALTLDNGVLLLETASNSGGDPRQLFDINCGTCIPGASTIGAGKTVAHTCKISPHGSADLCAEVTYSGEVKVVSCHESAEQVFYFTT